MGKLFGTDGVRGLANQHPMTGEIAMAVGRAVAQVMSGSQKAKRRATKKPKIVVGKDTRLSGYMLEQALASGVCSMGADVILIGPLPTPGVAFVTQSMRADAGVMISASHNPFYDNGIKIFSADGFKLPDEMENEIERIVESNDGEAFRPTAELVGKAFRIDDVLGRYLVFLKALFPKDLDLMGMKIVLDCANGAGYKVAPLVFEELGAEVVTIGVKPNGININEGCGALHPEKMAELVKTHQAHIGISLDGDGDRCILADEEGMIVDGDQIMGLCALELKQMGALKKNTIVTTPMSNVGLELSLKKHGIQMLRAQVGDRYVVEMMRKEGLNFGGEQSGHIVFLDHSTTGDGVIAALQILALMRSQGRTLGQLRKGITLFPQAREDVRVSKKTPFEQVPDIHQSIQSATEKMKNRGRVFVRYSGTENLARVMIEGENAEEIKNLARSIGDNIRKHLSAS